MSSGARAPLGSLVELDLKFFPQPWIFSFHTLPVFVLLWFSSLFPLHISNLDSQTSDTFSKWSFIGRNHFQHHSPPTLSFVFTLPHPPCLPTLTPAQPPICRALERATHPGSQPFTLHQIAYPNPLKSQGIKMSPSCFFLLYYLKRMLLCDGWFYMSPWLGYCTYLFNQSLI